MGRLQLRVLACLRAPKDLVHQGRLEGLRMQPRNDSGTLYVRVCVLPILECACVRGYVCAGAYTTYLDVYRYAHTCMCADVYRVMHAHVHVRVRMCGSSGCENRRYCCTCVLRILYNQVVGIAQFSLRHGASAHYRRVYMACGCYCIAAWRERLPCHVHGASFST